jgi:hypothetical protein
MAVQLNIIIPGICINNSVALNFSAIINCLLIIKRFLGSGILFRKKEQGL